MTSPRADGTVKAARQMNLTSPMLRCIAEVGTQPARDRIAAKADTRPPKEDSEFFNKRAKI